MSEAVLQVTNLVKKIKGKTILDHISFEVGQGDCLALIGPNGAGKTTLMSVFLVIRKPVAVKSLSRVKREKLKIKLRSFSKKIPFPRN